VYVGQNRPVAVVRKRVMVSGWVQGVFFRDTARRQAESRRIAGHARNLRDGRVELEFEGEAAEVEALVDWAHRGPSRAEVTGVEVVDVEPTGQRGFAVS
jgi:acylphosphatase